MPFGWIKFVAIETKHTTYNLIYLCVGAGGPPSFGDLTNLGGYTALELELCGVCLAV